MPISESQRQLTHWRSEAILRAPFSPADKVSRVVLERMPLPGAGIGCPFVGPFDPSSRGHVVSPLRLLPLCPWGWASHRLSMAGHAWAGPRPRRAPAALGPAAFGPVAPGPAAPARPRLARPRPAVPRLFGPGVPGPAWPGPPRLASARPRPPGRVWPGRAQQYLACLAQECPGRLGRARPGLLARAWALGPN